MKVTGSVTRTQSLKGTISKKELLGLVRETFVVPENAKARFYIIDDSGGTMTSQLIYSSMPSPPSPLVDVTDTRPMHFMIDWELSDAPNEQG